MNAEEVVLGAYAAFAKGDMKALAEANHPNAKYRVNGSHRLSGSYNGFEDFRDNFLSLIDKALPNFNLSIDKVVSNTTDVCVFVTITADGLNTKSLHHFVVEDELQTEFNIYDDSQAMAKAIQPLWDIDTYWNE